MKILFLTRLFYPHIGGVEKHVLKISELLVRKGYEITVITENLPRSYSKNYHSTGKSANLIGKVGKIKIIRINPGLNNWFMKFRIWKELWKQKNIIKDVDIVHCHDVFFWYLPFRFLYPFKSVFTTFHGYEGNTIPKTKEILMHKIAEVLSGGNICIGKFFKKWYGTKATYVSFGATESKEMEIMNNGKIMYLGRLEEEAGIMEYLKALKLLKDRKYKLKLDVFGGGSQRKLAENYIKKNKLDISFRGFVKNPDEYLINYEYVFVSRYLGILEALVKKKFVFAIYNNEIKKDYLEMTPFKDYIFISSNYTELAKELEYVIKNSNKEKAKIINGYNWARKQTWEKMTNLYFKLWLRNKHFL